jgi:hypothetical protein
MTHHIAHSSATWDACFERFAEFKSMACLKASGPDRRRPEREAVLKQLHRQFERERIHLPGSPSELTQEHLAVLLAARGATTRGVSARPGQAGLWNGLWRAIVFDRDNYQCCFCRRMATEGVDVPGEGRLAIRLELDHIEPRSAGGQDYTLANIRAICRTCNSARSRMTDGHFQVELLSIARAVFHEYGLSAS